MLVSCLWMNKVHAPSEFPARSCSLSLLHPPGSPHQPWAGLAASERQSSCLPHSTGIMGVCTDMSSLHGSHAYTHHWAISPLTVKHAIFWGCLTPRLESLTVGHRFLMQGLAPTLQFYPHFQHVCFLFYYKTHRAKVFIIFYCKCCISPLCHEPFYLLLLILKM